MNQDDFARDLADKMQDPEFLAGYEDGQQLDDLIDALIELRQEKHLTQTDVARIMGVKQPTVSGFENQDSDPRITTLQRYARALDARLCLGLELRDRDGTWKNASRTAKWEGTVESDCQSRPDFGWTSRKAIFISASFSDLRTPQWDTGSDEFRLAA